MNEARSPATHEFREARDFLLAHREDYATAYRDYRAPHLGEFNWATDWFDVLAGEQPHVTALWVVEEDGTEAKVMYTEMAELSQRFAGFLADAGIGRGDRVLLLLG